MSTHIHISFAKPRKGSVCVCVVNRTDQAPYLLQFTLSAPRDGVFNVLNGRKFSHRMEQVLLHINRGVSFLTDSTRVIDEIARAFAFREDMQPSLPRYTVIVAKCRRPTKKGRIEWKHTSEHRSAFPNENFPNHERNISDWPLPFNVSNRISPKDTSWCHRLTTIPDRRPMLE